MSNERWGVGLAPAAVVGATVALAAVFWAPAAQANPVDAYGAGFEGHAMAGARTALETSGAAAYANPAGLAMATATRLDLSVSDFGSSLNYNGSNGGSDSFAGAELAMVLPLPGLLKNGAVGIYGLFPTDDLARVVARDPNSPQFVQVGQLHRFALYASLAYKIGPVALGAGVQLLNSAAGSLQLSTDLAAAAVGQRVMTLDLVPAVAPVFGVAVDATEWLRFGGSYRGPGDIAVQLPSNVSLGPLGLELQLDALTYYRPPTWSLGAAFHGSFLAVDVEASFLQWSQAPDQGLQATVTTTSSLLPTLTTSPSGVRLLDTPVFRVGVAVPLPANLALFAGYAYVPTPVPSQTGPSNLLDNDRHEVSGGLSVSFGDPLGLSTGPMTFAVAGQYQALVSRQVQKQDPLDPYGDASYGGSLFGLTASLTLRFGATP